MRGSAAARLLGLRVRNMLCVVRFRSHCDGPVPPPVESYRDRESVCVCVIECDQMQQ
jgi:hypothetical protein